MSDTLRKVAVLVDLKRYDAAAEMLAPLLAAEPDNIEALNRLAQVAYLRGDYATCVEVSAAALEVQPDSQWSWRLRALAERQRSRHKSTKPKQREEFRESAHSAARRAVQLGPQVALNHDTLAFVLQDTDMAAALRAADRAVALDPENAGYHVRRGSLLRRGGRDGGRLGQAEAALREALRLDPESVDALHELALTDAAAGRDDAAEQALRRVAQSDPSRAESVRGTLRFLDRKRVAGKPGRRRARVVRRLVVWVVALALLRLLFALLDSHDTSSTPTVPSITFDVPSFDPLPTEQINPVPTR